MSQSQRFILLGSFLFALGLLPLLEARGQEPDRDPREELMLAVEMNDLRAARQAVREGGDLEIDFGNPSPLTTAVQLDLVPMVALLLELGGNPALAADAPLEVAVRNGSREMVRLLVREGRAALPEPGADLMELFDFALRSGDPVILEELLFAGGDPDLALASAVRDADFEAVLLTLRYGAKLSALEVEAALANAIPETERERFFASVSEEEERRHIAAAAAAAGDRELLELAFANGVEPAFEQLRLLAKNGHQALALRILDRLDSSPKDLLEEARASDSPELVRLLERQRREELRRVVIPAGLGLAGLALGMLVLLTVRRRTSVSPRRLHDAVARGNLARASQLLRSGADPSSWRDHHQPLHVAALNDNVRIARALLHHGAAVDGTANGDGDELGLSPLHLAATVGSVALAELLLRHGAAVDGRSTDGLTPLYAAASAGHGEMANLLIERGADPNALGPNGESLLLTAVSARDAAAARCLLDAGANPNADRGRTPLHAAAAAGEVHLVSLLLEHGAILGAADSTGRTPLDLARMHQRQEVLALLEKRPQRLSSSTDGRR